MWIYAWNKQLKEAYVGSTPVKEIYLWNTKVRPEEPKYNLDLNNGQPIWRLHDWELWYRVNVKDANEPFKIAVFGFWSGGYDWDISIDWAEPVRYHGSRSTIPISLSMSVGKHYVKITPHNWVVAGRAKCVGCEAVAYQYNTDPSKLEFWLERLPWYAFMKSETSVGDVFLHATWLGCTSLTSMPNWFSLPQGITSVGNYFLYCTWYNCGSLTSIPSWFKFPQGITSVGTDFLWRTWGGCFSLTSNYPAEPLVFPNVNWIRYANGCFWEGCPVEPDTPAPWSSVMVHRS